VTWADLSVIAATLLAAVFLVPQVMKLLRTGDTAGVSSTWPALGAVVNVAWFAYLSAQRLWLAVPSTVLMVAFYGTILRLLLRSGRPPIGPLRRGGTAALVLAATGAVAGWEGLGVVLGLSYGVQMAPSIWTAYRTAAPSGISPGTWWIGSVEAGLWGYYGWWHQDLAIAMFAITAALASGLMLARYYATRHRFSPAEA
jgi:uncharacterized protein with PQ loop repeat